MGDLNSVLDNLCMKLGTTVEFILPELISYKIKSSWLGLGISVLLFSVALLLLRSVMKLRLFEDKIDNAAFRMVSGVALGFVMVISLVGIIFEAYTLIMWTVSPYGASLDYILRMLGQ